jgi:ribosomal protein S18 acetylase RimI-like enzyme
VPDSAEEPPDAVTVMVRSRADDAAAMRDLARNAYAKYVERIGRAPAPMTADYEAIAASGAALLVWHGDALAGMLVTELDRGALLIENVAVAPQAQGSGLGSALMVEAERAVVDGYRRVFLCKRIAPPVTI